jgi:hypothetical protein
MVGAEDRAYIVDDGGVLYVLANKPGLHLVARSSLGEEVYASPALSHGALFIRGVKHLYCFD